MSDDTVKDEPFSKSSQDARQNDDGRTQTFGQTDRTTGSGSGRLEVRCPSCHVPIEVAVDTKLTDLTCNACGSHFSLVDQSKATRIAPSLSKLGRFELIERLGVGGFGSVWKARDKELDRTVAIKIPRAGDMTPEEQEKFFREARAAAQLRHPNIVSVHEVGRDGNSVYIVSDFVRGVTLADWLTGQKLTSREAAELCAKIANALHHAHEQGVVHRDLKPANIIIDGDGEPHLMDFGLARREVGEVTVTMDGHVLGTPAYMSPEQAEGKAHQADRRSDVYSLGVILFQLLTGELPFRGNARMLVHQVIHDEPPSPRKLNGNVSKDLETITLKCLEKDPTRRPSTASDLAAELYRYLSGEAIHSRPIGRIARSWRWAKRRPATAALLAVLAGVVVVGPIVAIQQTLLKMQRDQLLSDVAAKQATLETASSQLAQKSAQLEQKNDQLQNQLARNLIERGVAECTAGKVPQGIALFAAAHDAIAPDDPLRRSARNLIAGWYATMGTPLLLNAIVQVATFSPDDRVILTASNDGAVRQWEAETGKPRNPVIQLGGPPNGVVISSDGHTLFTGARNGTAQLWNMETGASIGEPLTHNGAVRAVALSPDGRLALTGSQDSTARLWDAKTGESLGEPLKHESSVRAVAFSPDGRLFVSGTSDGVVQLWDADTRKKVGKPMPHGYKVSAAVFSPEGNSVATGGWQGSACLWDTKTQKQVGAKMIHSSSVESLAFSPDGDTLLCGSYDHTARFWNARTGEAIGEPLRHDAAVSTVAFSHDGRKFLTGTWDNTVWRWDFLTRRRLPFGPSKSTPAPTELRHNGTVTAVAFTPDSRMAVTACSDGATRVWDVATGKILGEPLRHGDFVSAVAVSPDGRTIATGGNDSTARIWNLSDRQPFGEPMHHEGAVASVAFGPDGLTILTASSDNILHRWDAKTGAKLGTPLRLGTTIRKSKFAPNGRTAAIAVAGTVRVFDVATNKELGRVMHHPGGVLDVAFSPDGGTLLTACEDHTARFWDVQTGKLVGAPLRGTDEMYLVAFSPDGQTVFTGSNGQTARLWDVYTRKPVGEPLRDENYVVAVAFSPDGRWMLTCGGEKSARLWPVPSLPDNTNGLTQWAKGQTGFAVDSDGLIDRISLSTWLAARNRLPSQSGGASQPSIYLQPAISALRQSIGQQQTAELIVASVGTFGNVVFLNSMSDFRDDDCFTVVVPQSAIGALKNFPVSHVDQLVGRRLRATGILNEQNGSLEMPIDDPARQLEILTSEGQWLRPENLAAEVTTGEFVDPPVAKLRTLIGERQTIKFRVKLVGGRTHLYINSKSNFTDPDCFTTVIVPDQVRILADLGLNTANKSWMDMIVQVNGIVAKNPDRGSQIQIHITDVRVQLKILDDSKSQSGDRTEQNPAESPGQK